VQRGREDFGVLEDRPVQRDHTGLPVEFLVQAELVGEKVEL